MSGRALTFSPAGIRGGPRPRGVDFERPVWDAGGPRAAGMTALLLDRDGVRPPNGEAPMRGLEELWGRLGG